MTKARVRAAAGGVLAVGLLGVLLLGSSSRHSGSFIAESGPTVNGQLVVQFRGDIPRDQQEALLQAHGATFYRTSLVPGFVVASVPAGSEARIGQALAHSAVVDTVEENAIREPATIPNDPYYPQQWNMQTIGLDAARAQSDFGAGVTVAVLDTGVAYEDYQDGATHYGEAPDLSLTSFVKPCDISVVQPTDPLHCQDTHANDDYGHGTHVTGTIAESTNNGYGTAGIAPEASIMPVKVCGPYHTPDDPTHTKYGCPDDELADGIEYAVENGADIINMSIAGPGSSTDTSVNQLRAALDDARRGGVVVVAASGNEGAGTLDYPAAIDGVIAVGSVGFLENRASYSNYGKGEESNQLELVAPGGDPSEGPSSVILQQTYASCTSDSRDYAPQDFTIFPEATPCLGTSMAAPHVSGVAALIKSKFPDISATDIRNDLRCSADDLGAAGPDPYFGYGLVRADAALSDIDHDGIPDCIDSSVVTPHPTPSIKPTNLCTAATFTPVPTPSPSPTPVSTEQTETPSPSATSGVTGVSPSDTGTPTHTPTEAVARTATDTPTATPTDTPEPSDTPTPGADTDTPIPSPTPTPTPAPTPSPTPSPRCGDVDCNGTVNAADALGILQWLADVANAPCIGRGYVNCDAQLDVLDATLILQFSAELAISLPVGCP